MMAELKKAFGGKGIQNPQRWVQKYVHTTHNLNEEQVQLTGLYFSQPQPMKNEKEKKRKNTPGMSGLMIDDKSL